MILATSGIIQSKAEAPTGGIVTDGLLYHLDANNSDSYTLNGSTWTNLVSPGNSTMSLSSTTGGTESTGGKYINFDGVSSKGLVSNYTYGTVNTVQFWFNPTKVPSLYGIWISSGGTAYSYSAYDWAFFSYYQTPYQYEFLGSSDNSKTRITRSLSLNNWYFITLIRDNGTSNPLQVQINEGTPVTATQGAFNNTQPNFLRINQDGTAGCKFGQIIMYNRLLTSSEITQNFNFNKAKYGY